MLTTALQPATVSRVSAQVCLTPVGPSVTAYLLMLSYSQTLETLRSQAAKLQMQPFVSRKTKGQLPVFLSQTTRLIRDHCVP